MSGFDLIKLFCPSPTLLGSFYSRGKIPSGLPDQLVVHVRGLGHPGGVEHQVDVVVLVVVSQVGGWR
jgi:hypothetical protein